MKAIIIEATNDSPSILLDRENAKIDITGASFPENADDVYNEISKWICEIAPSLDQPFTCAFYYTYINSASKKKIYDILLQLEQIMVDGNQVVIEWRFDEYDDDMQELGYELKDLVKIPFNYIPMKSTIKNNES